MCISRVLVYRYENGCNYVYHESKRCQGCAVTLTSVPTSKANGAMSNVKQLIVDEQTALLSDGHTNRKRQWTPIPKLQLAIVLLLQSCELLVAHSILPYINQVYLVHLRITCS